MSPINRNPFFFLVGYPGPALELMSQLLACHPHLAVAPDIHFITKFFETRHGINPEALMTPELLHKWADQNRFAEFGFKRAEVRGIVKVGERVRLSAFIARLLDRFGGRQGKSLVGALTPSYTQVMPVLHAFWPQAKFIHVIQDGRDIFLADNGITKVESETEAVTSLALTWNRKVSHGRKAAKILGPELYCEARCEDFLSDPKEAYSRLCGFLTVPEEEIDSEWQAILEEKRDRIGREKWREQMPAESVELFEAAAGDLLSELGYPLQTPASRPEILTRVIQVRELFSHPFKTPSPRSLAKARRKNHWTNPFVFVIGCPRSGTTLLQRILDAHPQMAVCPESSWIVDYYQKRIGVTPDGLVTRDIIARLFEHPKFYRLRQDRQDLDKILGQGEPIPYAKFVSGIFDAYADLHGKPLAGEKTPDYVRHLTILRQLWPKAKFVHLLRDGRDVALSAMNWKRKADRLQSLFPTWKEHPLATAAAWWQWHVAPAREVGLPLGGNTYCELRYEDLVAQPERECGRLCAFMGLPFDVAMLRFHEGRQRTETGLDAKNAWQPITPGLRNWRQEMPPEDLELFEAVAGELLEELNYPRQFLRPAHETWQYASKVRENFHSHLKESGLA
jgi:Sulfotransferase family